ncbi:hypothetical protein C0Q70_20278 [Pomacea canaliculata]|uniref:BTB domain-containing protein n=1 Tax=Pomacea canaliculata TaxID=400727 RepID=A0A2T7NF23_POMCA|nr:hypothetical protein C0Q70_20278 [Pomacea canaliculata]
MDGDRQENTHQRVGKENPAKNKAAMNPNNMGNSHTSTSANARANQHDQAATRGQQQNRLLQNQQQQNPSQQLSSQQQHGERGQGERGHASSTGVGVGVVGDRVSPSSSPGSSSPGEANTPECLPRSFASAPQLTLIPGGNNYDSVSSIRSLPGLPTNLTPCTSAAVLTRTDSMCCGGSSCQGTSANAAKSANCGAVDSSSIEEQMEVSESLEQMISKGGDDGGCVGGMAASPPQNAINTAPFNWQSQKTSVKERLAFLYNTNTMADVHFLIGKEPLTQLVPAHKFVLSVSSVVFDALFNGGMASTESVIEIPDVEPAAFLALLKFLYTDDVQIGPETVMTTLYAAKKYDVPALERACVEFLKRNLSSDNAFMLLTQARLFDEQQLAALCLETIDKNTTEALAADGFTEIDCSTLCAVLERDTLGIRECKLFAAVCRWAEAECQRRGLPPTPENQKLVLNGALRLIRFPLMTVEEFAMGPAQSRLLEDREALDLFLYFTVNPKPPINFLDVPRCCMTGKEQVVSRFCQIESRWGYSGTSDRIRFMVNRRIFVVGFGLYGSIHGPTDYTVNIQILHMDSGKVMGGNDTSFQCDGSTSTFRVMFKEPVEILPNTNYIACATLKGPDSYYGSKGLRKVTHESVTSGKVTFQFTYAAGNNNGTSVEDGKYQK